MTLIISDTSPVTNLIKIELLSLLRDVYGQIIIPQSVYEELCEIESQKQLLDRQHSQLFVVFALRTSNVRPFVTASAAQFTSILP